MKLMFAGLVVGLVAVLYWMHSNAQAKQTNTVNPPTGPSPTNTGSWRGSPAPVNPPAFAMLATKVPTILNIQKLEGLSFK